MNENKSGSSAAGGGIGFVGLLTIAFIILKLCGVINWSWWWVLSPLWISVGLVIAVLLIIGIICLIAYLVQRRHAKKISKKEDVVK